MKRMLIPISLVFCLSSLARAASTLKIISTTQDPAAIANAIGGEHVSAESLTLGTRDPHYSEAKPSMIRKVSRANLLLLIGAELEIGWLPALIDSSRNRNILQGAPGYLDLSASVPLLDIPTGPVTRAMGDVHPLGNPHYWLNPQNGILMARAIAARLSELDPKNQSDYQANLAHFEEEINRKMADWRKKLSGMAGMPVISYHTSFTYLADAFGFQIAEQIEPKPGIAPSAGHLNQLVARIKNEHIKLIIMEPYYDTRPAKYLSDQTGIQVAIVPQSVGAFPEIHDYPGLFDGIVKVLLSAEGGGHE